MGYNPMSTYRSMNPTKRIIGDISSVHNLPFGQTSLIAEFKLPPQQELSWCLLCLQIAPLLPSRHACLRMGQ
jgi:hypothetical protein